MMHGIGCDLTHIPRVARLLSKFGDRFLNRAFHAEEIARYRSFSNPEQAAAFLAGRFV
jgi:holo-[acyl-carrier protein] synthase